MSGLLVLVQQLVHLHQLLCILELLFAKGDVHDVLVVMVGFFIVFLSSVAAQDVREMAP
jgi:hypothetical protein